MDLSEVVDPNARRHPWETARAEALRRILAGHGLTRAESVLDYGCGDAFTGRVIARALGAPRLVGVDSALIAEDEHTVRDRSALGSERFELLLLLDVLEHVDDDVSLLRELAEHHVSSGGAVLITVPAGPWLFGPHDEALGHRRRYTQRQIVGVARSAGLDPVGSGNLFAALWAVRAGERAAELLLPRLADRPRGIGRWNGGALTTRVIEAALVTEARALRWLEGRGAPGVGLSTWVLCRRP